MSRTVRIVLIGALLAAGVAGTASAVDVALYGRFERSIQNTKVYSDPYRNVTLNVTYTPPAGSPQQPVSFWGLWSPCALA